LSIHDLMKPRNITCVAMMSRGISSVFSRWTAKFTKFNRGFVKFFRGKNKLWALVITVKL